MSVEVRKNKPCHYWEAGYAEGLEKPVIYTCEKNKFNSEKTPFDKRSVNLFVDNLLSNNGDSWYVNGDGSMAPPPHGGSESVAP